MKLSGFINKKSITRRVWSVVLTIIMVFNLMCGYVAVGDNSKTVDAAVITPQYRNVMYYGEWSIYAGQKNFTPNKIPGNYMTHLNFAFLDVDENGNVISCDSWADVQNPNVGYTAQSDDPWAGVIPAMIQLRNEYPNMKIGFSVGGWTRSGDFPKVAASAATRKNFAENIAKTAHLYGYDFVDIDWEYPTADRDPDPEGNGVTVDKGCKGSAADKQNFTLLMQDLRAALDKYDKIDNKHYELSVAMSASPKMMEQIEYDKVLKIVDFANMMTYDLQGAWSAYTGHQTALYTNEAYDHTSQPDCQFSVDACIKYLYNTYGNTIDASKIVVGIAPYTRGWAGVKNDGRDPKNPGLFATATPNSVKAADGTTSGTFAYSDIGTLINQYGLKEYYDETAEAAYYYSDSTGYFFTCDNARSVTAKAKYVRNETGYKNPFNKPLGGLISWMASLDAAGEVTKTSHDALFGSGSQLKAQEIKFPEMENLATTVTASGDKYTITIKNNNKVTTPEKQGTLHQGAEANILYYAEKFAGSATYPTYYIKTANGASLSGSAWEAGGTIGKSGDYTTVSMTSWPYRLEPGETATLTLTDSTGKADASNIVEVGMTRKANANAAEFGWTSLVGKSTQPSTTQSGGQQTTTKTQQPATTQSGGQQTTTKAQTATGNYPEWSAQNVSYKVGDLVQYQNKVFECIIPHTSHDGWPPIGGGATLWKERTDLVAGSSEKPSSGEEETDNNYTVNGVLPQHTVTGYWHNFSNGSTNLKLAEVPTYYDVICVAFTGNTATPGEATFGVSEDLQKSIGYTDAQFIQDVKTLKARNQHVLISVGGAEGRIEINSNEAADKFAESMIAIIEKFGFEGVDIDLEGAAVSGTNYIASALRKMRNHFGENFIITMAPETAYMTPGGAGFSSYYWNLAISIKDILTTVHTQFYNTGGMNGYGGGVANPGNASFPANLSTLYIESGLRPDQVAIGVPSSQPAATSGQITPAQAVTAFNAMVYGTSADGFTPPKAYPTFRGLMTWSINWDAKQDYAWAKAAKAAINAAPVTEQPTNKPDVPTKEETTTTKTQVGGKQPIEVIGLTTTAQEGPAVTFAWGQTEEQMALGQSYNVYIDGKFHANYTAATQVTYTFATNGTHTIKVTAALDGKETAGASLSVNVTGASGSVETTSEKKEEEQTTKKQTTSSTTGLSSRLMIGYYHTWSNDGNPFIKLRDVDSNWDVINISFAEPVSAGSTDGKMKFNISGLSSSYTKDDFKKDVKDLQAKGKKIVLSIGGYEGYFSLDSTAAINQFVSDIKGFVDEYGFDGIDIDLEQSSVNFNQGNDTDIRTIKSPRLANMVSAIRTIVNSYGDDFILSWAPETFYVQMGYTYYAGINQYCDARAGSYLPMINALRKETSYVHVQLYNSSPVTAPDGVSYNMGTKEGVVAMCKMLLEGFHVGAGVGVAKSDATYFAPLRPDQVVIGVPSSSSAAGSGQLSNANLQAAFSELEAAYPGIRGIMSWSINWDSVQNGNSFVRENQAYLSTLRNDEEETTQKEPEEETTTAPDSKTITISDKVKIEGYQMSTTLGGSRVVGSVEPTINNKNVTKWGFIYAVDSMNGKSLGVTDTDMYVGTTNKYIVSMDSTPVGTSDTALGNSQTATYFVRTTLFATNTAVEYSTKYKVRAYALLEDGSYVYSNVRSYSVYDICDNLYQNRKMNTSSAHDYLYNKVLKVVNPSYKEVDYNWSSIVVK